MDLMSDKFVKAFKSSAQAPDEGSGWACCLSAVLIEWRCKSFNAFSFHHIRGREQGADSEVYRIISKAVVIPAQAGILMV